MRGDAGAVRSARAGPELGRSGQVSISTSGFTFAFGTVSDELNLIKTLDQEENHSGGLHRAVHEGLDTARDVTWPASKDGILPGCVQGYSYTVRKKGGFLETGMNACAA